MGGSEREGSYRWNPTFTAGLPSTGPSNATQSFKRFLVTGRQASLEQVLQRGLIGSG